MKTFVCLLAVATAVGAAKPDRCHLRELDMCAAAAAGSKKLPSTHDEIDKYCTIGKEAKNCVEKFVQKCTTPVQREVITWAAEGAIKNVDEFCMKGSKTRNDYLKYAPCLARAQPSGKKCVDDIVAGLERLEVAKITERIPTACCMYDRFRQCSVDIVKEQCGQEAITHGTSVLEKNLGTSLSFICQGSAGSPKCDSLLPPLGSKAVGSSKSAFSKLFSAYVSS